MTEKQTPPKNDEGFMRRAASYIKDHPVETAIAIGVTGAAGFAAGAAAEGAHREAVAQEGSAAIEQAEIEAHENLVDALNAQYDADSLIKMVRIPEGGNLEGQALNAIYETLGDDVYNDTKPLFYDLVHDSAKAHGIVHPGDEFAVIETDYDGDSSNGKEYLVVKPTQIVHSDITELPTPDTH